MKCWSRSTLGVAIGTLHIVVSIICVIGMIFMLVTWNTEGEKKVDERSLPIFNRLFSILIVICVALTIISGLMIRGILKRRHKLMIPWLLITGIFVASNWGNFTCSFVGLIAEGAPLTTISFALVLGVGGIALSVLILWPICTLFADIRKENIEKPDLDMSSAKQVEYQTSPNYYKL